MKKKAFTLMEILIVVSLLIVLFVGVILLINPLNILNRGYDITRKKDLDDAKKMLEQYITDTGCYPQPTQICKEGDNKNNCHICTKNQPAKLPQFTKDICDPRETGLKGYLYQTEMVGPAVTACPKWFIIYSVLDSAYNAQEDIWGCKKGGCGVSPVYGYSYLVTSPGAPVNSTASNNWYCFADRFNRCLQCSPYENCMSPSNDCYRKVLYPARQTCCTEHGRTYPC